MFWWLRKLFWWPRYTYQIAVGSSHASAEEAKQNALIQAGKIGGTIMDITASAMCCSGEQGSGAEWDVYILVRI
jgi:hypothetical protein